MIREIHGSLDGKGKKFAIVVSRFNELITQNLLKGALDCLTRHGASEDDITVYWTPGAFEIPLVADKVARKGQADAVICLGSVIRGGTPHFNYIAAEAAKGIAGVSAATGMPVIFGVLTCDTIEQALERAGTKAGNKGWDAALSALEMANLLQQI